MKPLLHLRPIRRRQEGGVIFVIFLLLVVGLGAYFYMGGTVDDLRARLTGVPVEKSADQQEGTEISPAAPAHDDELDLATVAKDRRLWPKAVALRKKTAFDAVHNGRVVGTVDVPAGLDLPVVSMDTRSVTVNHMGATKVLPLAETDFLERAARRGR